MALTKHYFTKFEEGNFYHVYNRAVDRKPMFTEKGNYDFFMTRMEKYLIPYLDVYAFCLLDNHFHLLVKIKELQKDLKNDSATLKELPTVELPTVELPNLKPASMIVSAAFRKMFQSYAMAFNKQENRIGTLFQEPFKRNLINSEEYLFQLIHYIHFNPQKHGLVSDFRDYSYSSFPYYMIKKFGNWVHEEMYELFGGYEQFIEFHNNFPHNPDKKYGIENE